MSIISRCNSLFLFLIMIAFQGCNFFFQQPEDPKVARVGENFLYQSDLDKIVDPGTSRSDSIKIVKRYIDRWIRQQIFLKEAKTKLPEEKNDFSRKVEDYKNSLVIFAYENFLLNNQLDTIVTQEMLNQYYEEHKEDFKLRDNIVKVNFLKLPLDAPDVWKVRNMIRSEDPEDIKALEDYALNHAATYFLHNDTWFLFEDILRDFPLDVNNHEQFLSRYKFREVNDDYYRYMIHIKDYKLEGSTSPLAFQSDNIKAIILNHRKQKFINEFRQELYKTAIQNSDFEVFESK